MRNGPVLVVCLLITALRARAQNPDVFIGRDHFPQFRNFSALSGGGFGVDDAGYLSLFGATALSTPIAHVLDHDEFMVDAGAMSFDSGPTVDTGDSNFTDYAVYGHSFGRLNAALSLMVVSTQSDHAFNFQVQYVMPRERRLQLAAGVQDNPGLGGSAFGSASAQVAKPLRVWTEHDGFGVNAGVLFHIVRFPAPAKSIERVVSSSSAIWCLGSAPGSTTSARVFRKAMV